MWNYELNAFPSYWIHIAFDARETISRCNREGEPWIFSNNPAELDQYLDSNGLDLIEQFAMLYEKQKLLDTAVKAAARQIGMS